MMRKLIKTALSIILSAAMILSLSGCTSIFGPGDEGGSSKPAVEHIEHITIGTTAVPEDVNILSRSGSLGQFSYTCAVNASLFVRGEFNKMRGYFALDYALSEDGREIRIAFPTTFKWHDGEKVTLDDLVFTLEYRRDVLKDEALATLREIRKTADNQAVLVFSGPDAYKYLRSESALAGIMPKHIWENVSADQAAEYKGAGYNVGCGPYKVSEIGTDTVELELFPGNDYLGEARIDRITIKTYPDKTALLTALAAKEIDYIYDYGSPADRALADFFSGVEGLDPGSVYGQDVDAAVFDPDMPTTSSAGFRKAVLLSLDRNALKEIFCGDTGRVPSSGFLSPSAIGFDDSVENLAMDPEEAARQLDKAGFKDTDEDGWRELPDGGALVFRIVTQDLPERQELYDKAGAVMVDCLKKVGIRAFYLGPVTDAGSQEIPVPAKPADDDADAEDTEPEPLPDGYELMIGRTESGKDPFRTSAYYLLEAFGSDAPEDTYYDLRKAFYSLEASINDDRYVLHAKELQRLISEDLYGFALAWEEYFFPYRTDEFEGQSFLPDTGEVNYMLFYKIKKK